jgi:hypothetical protein
MLDLLAHPQSSMRKDFSGGGGLHTEEKIPGTVSEILIRAVQSVVSQSLDSVQRFREK